MFWRSGEAVKVQKPLVPIHEVNVRRIPPKDPTSSTLHHHTVQPAVKRRERRLDGGWMEVGCGGHEQDCPRDYVFNGLLLQPTLQTNLNIRL